MWGGWKSLDNCRGHFCFLEPRRTTAKRLGFLLHYKYSLTHPILSPRILYKETYLTQGFLDYLILYKFFDALTLQSHAAGVQGVNSNVKKWYTLYRKPAPNHNYTQPNSPVYPHSPYRSLKEKLRKKYQAGPQFERPEAGTLSTGPRLTLELLTFPPPPLLNNVL
jgi:hypothetical protein